MIDVWRGDEEKFLGQQLELFQDLLESKKEADEQRNHNRLLFIAYLKSKFIAYLKSNELWMIGGWHWLE